MFATTIPCTAGLGAGAANRRTAETPITSQAAWRPAERHFIKGFIALTPTALSYDVGQKKRVARAKMLVQIPRGKCLALLLFVEMLLTSHFSVPAKDQPA